MGSPTPENSSPYSGFVTKQGLREQRSGCKLLSPRNMKRFCILQVEDDPNDVSLFAFGFQKYLSNHILKTVSSGREARAYLAGEGVYANRELYPFPDIVLLDLKLPDEDGFEILRWIRAQPRMRSLVVLLFSASVFPGDVEKALACGANSYVAKFMDLDELAAFCQALEAYWFNFHIFHSPQCLRLQGTSIAA